MQHPVIDPYAEFARSLGWTVYDREYGPVANFMAGIYRWHSPLIHDFRRFAWANLNRGKLTDEGRAFLALMNVQNDLAVDYVCQWKEAEKCASTT